MEAAGLKSSSTRAPRKSKGSGAGTPSSTSSAPVTHLPSPYATPTSQGPSAYAPYTMYDPGQYGYPSHPLPPPGVTMAQTQSGASSRVPSPVNGHSSSHPGMGSMPGHQQYFPQPFSPAYSNYPSGNIQPYRYPSGMPAPYGGPPHHHPLYSSSMNQDHGGQPLYSPMNASFQTHSRESSYGVITPGYPPNPMANGYPPRTQTSTPLSQAPHEDRRYPSPPGRRRSPPDMISQGVVDPNSMSRIMPIPSGYAGYHTSYTYGNGSHGPMGISGRDPVHRASISSLSDGSGAGGSDGSAAKGASRMINGSMRTNGLAPIHPV